MFQAWRKNSKNLLLAAGFFSLIGCSGAPFYDEVPFVRVNRAPYRIYKSDFSTAWEATLQAISLGRDVIRYQNRDLGTIESEWIENTDQHAFLQAFSSEDFFLRSRYKLQVQVREGTKNGEAPVVMVRVLKVQQMERTFLGGWEDVDTDGIDESTYLYLIGRKISLRQMEEKKPATL
jgi:hypothetical protein